MKFEYHVVTSFAAGAFAYALFRSIAVSAGILAGGILIDLDHFFDYFSCRGVRLDLKELCHLSYNNLFPKLYIFLHSYEIILGILLAFLLGFRNPFVLGIAIGLAVHLVFDQIFNKASPITYFLVYRAIIRFDAERLYRPRAINPPGTVVPRNAGDDKLHQK